MLKIQKRQNEMNHKVLQDSICLQREVKGMMGAIYKRKESGSVMRHSSNRSIKKCSRHEGSEEIDQAKMKYPVKGWKCGGHHCRQNCPIREHQEGSSHKVTRLGDEPKDENQQEKLVEAKGLGLESSKKILEHRTNLQNF